MDSWRDKDEDDVDGVEDNFNAGGKDAIIFMIDATKNMHLKQESGDSPFQMVSFDEQQDTSSALSLCLQTKLTSKALKSTAY